jgi:uncharacterized protein (DUF1330 family)
MISILVTIEVKSFDLLADFESKAVKVMHTHGGDIVNAFETQRNEDGSGQEVHLLEFPSHSKFDEYRSDSLLLEYADLRTKAIKSSTVVISTTQKNYR